MVILKKAITILLVFFIIFDSFGYIFVYFQTLHYLKEHSYEILNNYISENDFELIKDNNRFSQILKTDDNEIKYNDKLYDVYKEEQIGDFTYYYCLRDENEEVLQKVFSDFENNKTKNDSSSPLRNIINNLIIVAIPQTIIKVFYDNFQFLNISLIQNCKPQNIISVPTPPPKFS